MFIYNCSKHGFRHDYSGVSIPSSIKLHKHDFMKFCIDKVEKYGKLRGEYVENGYRHYVFEMSEECPHGYSKVDNKIFSCNTKRGIIIQSDISMCIKDGTHEQLCVHLDKRVDQTTVCCMKRSDKLYVFPNLSIDEKFILRRGFFDTYVGICKWMGTINNEESIEAEMASWISNDSDGCCMGVKIFDCRHGHGIFLRASDVQHDLVTSNELQLNDYGFVNLPNIFHIQEYKMGTAEMGKRAKLVVKKPKKYDDCMIETSFGVVKWIGKINKEICVGIELDYSFEGAMNGVIFGSESFQCEPEHGVVCPIDSVAFDYYAYSANFTVCDGFDIDSAFIYEDWNQLILQKRNLGIDKNVHVYIEKCNRIFRANGVLRWCGYIDNVAVGILVMDENFPITNQQKIGRLLKEKNESPYIVVSLNYLFKYRIIKSYEKFEDSIFNFDIGRCTEFGTVKWQGVDENDNLYYGFELDSSSADGTNGTFSGQNLFQCNNGCGILVPAKKIRPSVYSKICGLKGAASSNQPKIDSSMSNTEKENIATLLTNIATKGDISSEELLSDVIKTGNECVFGSVLNKMSTSVGMGECPDLVEQLLASQSFDALAILVDRCSGDEDNDEQLLQVAAQSLKYGNLEVFKKCMDKCDDKNVLMDNGETFLTHIIKIKIDQSLILHAIKEYKLDLAKVNEEKRAPLTLAFSSVMMDVVEYIANCFKDH